MSAATSIDNVGRVHLRIVSDSELRTLRACMRRHHYAYNLRRRPLQKGEALRFGTLWHVGQEVWWGHDGPPVEKLEIALVALRNELDVDPYALVTAEELLVAYTARWSSSPLRALAVEIQFDMPLINPETNAPSRTFRRGGKIDVVAVDGDEQCIIEHKTTSYDIEEGSSYLRKVRALDTQVSTYMAGAKSLGYAPTKCVYDVVRKPGIRPLKATPEESKKYTKDGRLYANQRDHDETPEEYRARLRLDINERPDRYFARVDIVRLEEEEREHAFDVWQTTRLMREAENNGFAPKNPDACSNFGACPYLVVCEGMASIDDDTLFRTASTAHEELAES
jgi:hypothetical protein